MVVEPCAELEGTNWLTNAYDAEPGMDVVYAEEGDVRREEITDVLFGTVWTKDSEVDCEYINNVDHIVIE